MASQPLRPLASAAGPRAGAQSVAHHHLLYLLDTCYATGDLQNAASILSVLVKEYLRYPHSVFEAVVRLLHWTDDLRLQARLRLEAITRMPTDAAGEEARAEAQHALMARLDAMNRLLDRATRMLRLLVETAPYPAQSLALAHGFLQYISDAADKCLRRADALEATARAAAAEAAARRTSDAAAAAAADTVVVDAEAASSAPAGHPHAAPQTPGPKPHGVGRGRRFSSVSSGGDRSADGDDSSSGSSVSSRSSSSNGLSPHRLTGSLSHARSAATSARADSSASRSDGSDDDTDGRSISSRRRSPVSPSRPQHAIQHRIRGGSNLSSGAAAADDGDAASPGSVRELSEALAATSQQAQPAFSLFSQDLLGDYDVNYVDDDASAGSSDAETRGQAPSRRSGSDSGRSSVTRERSAKPGAASARRRSLSSGSSVASSVSSSSSGGRSPPPNSSGDRAGAATRTSLNIARAGSVSDASFGDVKPDVSSLAVAPAFSLFDGDAYDEEEAEDGDVQSDAAPELNAARGRRASSPSSSRLSLRSASTSPAPSGKLSSSPSALASATGHPRDTSTQATSSAAPTSSRDTGGHASDADAATKPPYLPIVFKRMKAVVVRSSGGRFVPRSAVPATVVADAETTLLEQHRPRQTRTGSGRFLPKASAGAASAAAQQTATKQSAKRKRRSAGDGSVALLDGAAADADSAQPRATRLRSSARAAPVTQSAEQQEEQGLRELAACAHVPFITTTASSSGSVERSAAGMVVRPMAELFPPLLRSKVEAARLEMGLPSVPSAASSQRASALPAAAPGGSASKGHRDVAVARPLPQDEPERLRSRAVELLMHGQAFVAGLLQEGREPAVHDARLHGFAGTIAWRLFCASEDGRAYLKHRAANPRVPLTFSDEAAAAAATAAAASADDDDFREDSFLAGRPPASALKAMASGGAGRKARASKRPGADAADIKPRVEEEVINAASGSTTAPAAARRTAAVGGDSAVAGRKRPRLAPVAPGPRNDDDGDSTSSSSWTGSDASSSDSETDGTQMGKAGAPGPGVDGDVDDIAALLLGAGDSGGAETAGAAAAAVAAGAVRPEPSSIPQRQNSDHLPAAKRRRVTEPAAQASASANGAAVASPAPTLQRQRSSTAAARATPAAPLLMRSLSGGGLQAAAVVPAIKAMSASLQLQQAQRYLQRAVSLLLDGPLDPFTGHPLRMPVPSDGGLAVATDVADASSDARPTSGASAAGFQVDAGLGDGSASLQLRGMHVASLLVSNPRPPVHRAAAAVATPTSGAGDAARRRPYVRVKEWALLQSFVAPEDAAAPGRVASQATDHVAAAHAGSMACALIEALVASGKHPAALDACRSFWMRCFRSARLTWVVRARASGAAAQARRAARGAPSGPGCVRLQWLPEPVTVPLLDDGHSVVGYDHGSSAADAAAGGYDLLGLPQPLWGDALLLLAPGALAAVAGRACDTRDDRARAACLQYGMAPPPPASLRSLFALMQRRFAMNVDASGGAPGAAAGQLAASAGSGVDTGPAAVLPSQLLTPPRGGPARWSPDEAAFLATLVGLPVVGERAAAEDDALVQITAWLRAAVAQGARVHR